MRTPQQAVAWALAVDTWATGYCQQFVRSCFDVPAYYGTARAAWDASQRKHYCEDGDGIPAGVPVFWRGGSRGFGHVALSLGGGMCRSTDWPYAGHVGTARINDITASWHEVFCGWTEDINRVLVWTDPTPLAPPLDASVVAVAARHHDRAPQGIRLKEAVRDEVGRGRMNLGSKVLAGHFTEQYALVQRAYLKDAGVPASAPLVDGIPGPASLTWLGHRHGFEVVG